MFSDARGQSLHIVAAFEQRQDAALAVTLGGFDDPPRDLAVRLLGYAHAAEGIAAVSVEAGGEEDRIRLVIVDDRTISSSTTRR